MTDVVSERTEASSDASPTRRARRERDRGAAPAHAGTPPGDGTSGDASDEPLLTAENVRDARFHTTRDVPGYDQREVDAFLELVQLTLERLQAEREVGAAGGQAAPATAADTHDPDPAPWYDDAAAAPSDGATDADASTGYAGDRADADTADTVDTADAAGAVSTADAAHTEAPGTDQQVDDHGAWDEGLTEADAPVLDTPVADESARDEPAADDATMVLPGPIPALVDDVPAEDRFRHEPATPPPGVPALVEDTDTDLTGDDVRRARFPVVTGVLGYVVVEVDDFLDRLAGSLDARWYGGTPDLDAHAVEAARFPTTWRGGYDQDAVDELLDRAASALAGR